MNRPLLLLAGGMTLLVPAPAAAQAERYELGQRLRAFMIELDACDDPLAYRRAAPCLKQTVWVPFSLQPGLAAQKLDQARFALRSPKAPPSELRWAESLWLLPASRFVDINHPELPFSLRPFYPVEAAIPAEARLRLTLTNAAGQALPPRWEAAIESLPIQASLSLRGVGEGDHLLQVDIEAAGKPLVRRRIMVSVVDDQARRLAALRRAVEGLPLTPVSTQRESVRRLAGLLERLARRETLETDHPAHRLLTETEAALRMLSANEPFYSAGRSGDFWLNLAAGDQSVPARLLVPEGAGKGKPVPLVVALHGASGSENLFFDGYGPDAIVKLCRERGWLLLSPRLTALGGQLPIPEMVEELSRLYPVSRRHIYLVGHSLGAAQAVLNSGRAPERFAAVAALGGGGLVRPSDPFRAIPFFVGVGSEDFALSWARNLHQSLREAGVGKVNFREYPGIDHLAIPKVALRDVFHWLDDIHQQR